MQFISSNIKHFLCYKEIQQPKIRIFYGQNNDFSVTGLWFKIWRINTESYYCDVITCEYITAFTTALNAI